MHLLFVKRGQWGPALASRYLRGNALASPPFARHCFNTYTPQPAPELLFFILCRRFFSDLHFPFRRYIALHRFIVFQLRLTPHLVLVWAKVRHRASMAFGAPNRDICRY